MLTFVVPGTPVAQPRPRAAVRSGHAVVYGAAKSHPIHVFKAATRLAASQAACGASPMEGPLMLAVLFVLPRPGRLRWRTRPMPRLPHDRKPDADNLAKAILDACNGILWRDDAQLVQLAVEKLYAAGDESPHVAVTLEPYGAIAAASDGANAG